MNLKEIFLTIEIVGMPYLMSPSFTLRHEPFTRLACKSLDKSDFVILLNKPLFSNKKFENFHKSREDFSRGHS